MRAAALALALVACSPDIVSGSYLCGPDEACPEDQKCNGGDHVCVTPGMAGPFGCVGTPDLEPDDTIAQAVVVPTPNCVSTPFSAAGCLPVSDSQDWYTFAVPMACGTTTVEVRLTFPLAWETLAVELWDGTATTMLTTEGPCTAPPADGDVANCLSTQVAPGASYGLVVKPAGGGDCNGRCANNVYNLSLRLAASI